MVKSLGRLGQLGMGQLGMVLVQTVAISEFAECGTSWANEPRRPRTWS